MSGFASASFAVTAFSLAAFAFDAGYVDRTYPLQDAAQELPVNAAQPFPVTLAQGYAPQGMAMAYPGAAQVFALAPMAYPALDVAPVVDDRQAYPLQDVDQRYPA